MEKTDLGVDYFMLKHLDISNTITADHKFFSDFRPGDWVRIDWPKRLTDNEARPCYGAAGEVVYVGRDYLTLRGIHGFTFCISRADVIEGALVRLSSPRTARRHSGEADEPLLRAVFG
ncbi:hypothetical protein [Neomoorella thermoacetica]|uniref:hypothetical protein n=1 Tax=Neomoorella thermoacetica TaxID=1525 RepID=UPI0030CBEB11